MSLGRLIKLSGLALLHGASKPLPSLKQKALNRTANARGIPTKVTQVLATFKKSDAHLKALKAMEALPLEAMVEVLRDDAPQLLTSLESISEGAHPASLGQVHQAEKDGQTFALKLQYPSAVQDMAFDQAWMDRLAQTFATFRQGFGLKAYKRELKEGLQREMDFMSEALTMETFHNHFQNHEGLVIPNPSPKSSGRRHVLMSWEGSEPLEPKKLSKKDTLSLQSSLEHFFLDSLFSLGQVHADPNPGNFGVREEGEQFKWVIYDFGAVHVLDEETRLGLLLLLRMAEDRKGDPYPLLVRLGFDASALEPIREKLLAFIFILFEPFLSDGRFHLDTWNRSKRTHDVLGEQRYQFMVAAPTHWIGLMRALQGFFHYSELLGVGVYLRKKIETYFHRHAQAMAILRDGLEELPLEISQYLHIQVKEGYIEKVKVIFKAECVECLEELMEEDTLKSLQEQDIDIEEIKTQARANSYRPMELFTRQIGEKTIRVFID